MDEYIKREDALRHRRKMSGADFGGRVLHGFQTVFPGTQEVLSGRGGVCFRVCSGSEMLQ